MRALIILALALLVSKETMAQAPIVKITDGARSVYLVGSNHFGERPLGALPKLLAKIPSPLGVCIESDSRSTNELASRRYIAAITMPSGSKLSSTLPRNLISGTERLLARRGISIDLESLSPFAITLFLEKLLDTDAANLEMKNSVDEELREFANIRGAPFSGFDSEGELFNSVARITPAAWSESIGELLDFLGCEPCLKRHSIILNRQYVPSNDPNNASNAFTLAARMIGPRYAAVSNDVYLGSNVYFSKFIEEQLKAERPRCDVIGVGAAHLGGNNGLVERLHRRGYVVEVM